MLAPPRRTYVRVYTCHACASTVRAAVIFRGGDRPFAEHTAVHIASPTPPPTTSVHRRAYVFSPGDERAPRQAPAYTNNAHAAHALAGRLVLVRSASLTIRFWFISFFFTPRLSSRSQSSSSSTTCVRLSRGKCVRTFFLRSPSISLAVLLFTYIRRRCSYARASTAAGFSALPHNNLARLFGNDRSRFFFLSVNTWKIDAIIQTFSVLLECFCF